MSNGALAAWAAGALACAAAAFGRVSFRSTVEPFHEELHDVAKDGAAAVLSTLSAKEASKRARNLDGFGDLFERIKRMSVAAAAHALSALRNAGRAAIFSASVVAALGNGGLAEAAKKSSRKTLCALCLVACIAASVSAEAEVRGTDSRVAAPTIASYAARSVEAYDRTSDARSVLEENERPTAAKFVPSSERAQTQDGNCVLYALADAMERSWGANLSSDDVERLSRVLMASFEAGNSLLSISAKLASKFGLELPVSIVERGVVGEKPDCGKLLSDILSRGGSGVVSVMGWSAFEGFSPSNDDDTLMKGFAGNPTLRSRVERAVAGTSVGHAVTVVGETNDAFLVVNPFREWGRNGVALVDKDALLSAAFGVAGVEPADSEFGKLFTEAVSSVSDEEAFSWGVSPALLELDAAAAVMDGADPSSTEDMNIVLSMLALVHAHTTSPASSFLSVASLHESPDGETIPLSPELRGELEASMLRLHADVSSGRTSTAAFEDARRLLGEYRDEIAEFGNFVAENGWGETAALRAAAASLGARFDADGNMDVPDEYATVGQGALFHAASFLGMLSPETSLNEESGVPAMEHILYEAFGNGSVLDGKRKMETLELIAENALPSLRANARGAELSM